MITHLKVKVKAVQSCPRLKLQYFGHLKRRVNSLEKTLMLGGIGGRRIRGQHHAAVAAKLLQLCPTLSDPMDCSLPGSSIHGIFQARVLEWGAIAFSVSSIIVLSKRQSYSGITDIQEWNI